MALANDMTSLLKKISRRLGMVSLEPHLPKELQLPGWAKTIEEDTFITFSRYYPNRLKMVINDETCDKKTERGNAKVHKKQPLRFLFFCTQNKRLISRFKERWKLL